LEQTSPVVQTLLSLQAFLLGVCTQLPVAVSQVSFVQTLPSSQFLDAPVQAPLEQISPVVQALLSLQGSVLLAWMQTPPTQESVVQTLPSSQFLGGPEHTPCAQKS
jgi:hypothetical protein